MNKSKKLRMSKLWLLSVVGVSACYAPTFTPHKPESMQEAASVHVAVLSVAPWSVYEPLLQPKMSVTIENAEAMAVPVTSDYVRNVYDAFNGKFQAGWGTGKTSLLPTWAVRRRTPQRQHQGLVTAVGQAAGRAAKARVAKNRAAPVRRIPPAHRTLRVRRTLRVMGVPRLFLPLLCKPIRSCSTNSR
ncbi:hypothetical protein LFL96_22270 [Paraburkholderia sp. D15]|uniref:hypothetical protein n=1 Tax=Paraburkholderia sp. D15 TaxID=2880218 RepID=UPI00247A08E9|nr:hypothetical protein [Paraburkholderia sp. D15]WGS53774.1 hypothetical protein LFL96_22270 [Paraburkholderia sp. D15]